MQPSPSSSTGARSARRPALAIAVLAGALALGATSQAQGQVVGDVDVGVVERSTVFGCPISGAPATTQGAQGAVLVDLRPKRAGEVFYAAALIGSASNCFSQVTSIGVVPPVGVELAISAATPVLCKYDDASGPPETITPAQGCPQQATQGAYGFLLNRTSGPRAPLWDLTQKEPLFVEFPLRASRSLAGLPAPSCGRTPNVSPPCRPDQAGDSLQVGYFVAGSVDTWLVPHVGLTVAAAPAPATATPAPTGPPAASGAPAARASLAVPRALRIRRALRGIPVTVQVPGDAVVRAQVRAARLRGVRGGLIASVTRRAKAGTLKLRLKPTSKATRALRRKRLVVATVRVTVTPRGGAAQTATARVTLRR